MTITRKATIQGTFTAIFFGLLFAVYPLTAKTQEVRLRAQSHHPALNRSTTTLVGVPDTLWSEDWEDPNWLTRWSVADSIWQAGTPASGPGSAHGGIRCAATVLDGNYPNGANTRLERIQSFTVPPANQNPRLRFWQWFNITTAICQYDAADYGVVQVKMGNGAWQDVSPHYNNYSGDWTYASIDLTPYADSVISVGFLFSSGGCNTSPGWYIDDLALVSGPITFNNIEGWESGLGDWSAERGVWQVGVPDTGVGPGYAHSGAACAATILNGNYPDGASSRLVSPRFTVPPAGQNPRLRFWQWFNITTTVCQYDATDFGIVQIKVGDGGWQDVSLPLNNFSGDWTCASIDLSPYADSVVSIGFLFSSGGCYNSAGWYIDDLALVTGPITFNNSEGWESGIGDWSAERGIWQVGVPDTNVGPKYAHSGVNCAATILNGNYPDGANSRFISPKFTVPSAGLNPRLRFWHWFDITTTICQYDNWDYGVVQVKTRNGVWHDISPQYYNNGGDWTYAAIDLTPYADSAVSIGFLFSSGGCFTSSGWYIDDIALVTGPLTVNNPEGWESGIGDWSAERGIWQVGIPDTNVGPRHPHSGMNCAGTILSGDYPPGGNSRLVSPRFTVPSACQNPRLGFWHWYSISTSTCQYDAPDFGVVQVRVGGGGWQSISPQYYNSSGGWTYDSLDLSPYADSIVSVGFLLSTGGCFNSSGWYIDEVGLMTQLDSTVHMAPAWNMISVPFAVPDYRTLTLFPTASSRAFSYQGHYVAEETLKNGVGYWLKYARDTVMTLTGVVQSTDTVPVTRGWNMIGSISTAINTASIASIPPGLVTSQFWGYSGSYVQTTCIKPGYGYWVKIDSAGKLILSSSESRMAGSGRIRIVAVNELPPQVPDDFGDGQRQPANIPAVFALGQNYPNPFNPTTTLRYQLPEESRVRLRIYDILGQTITVLVDGVEMAGYKTVAWDASGVSSGIYFYILEATSSSDPARGISQVKKMLLLK